MSQAIVLWVTLTGGQHFVGLLVEGPDVSTDRHLKWPAEVKSLTVPQARPGEFVTMPNLFFLPMPDLTLFGSAIAAERRLTLDDLGPDFAYGREFLQNYLANVERISPKRLVHPLGLLR